MLKLSAACLATLLAATAAQAQTPVARGDYLVNSIMACGNCHTPQGPNGPVMEKHLSGGIRFDEPPFDVTASNITQDKSTGIGSWTDADLKRGLSEGVRPNGVPLAPIMPNAFYKVLTPGDLNAIVAYLKTVKPIENKSPAPIYKIALPPMVFPGGEKPLSEADLADKVKRGFYLATIGHCMECHTPMNDKGHDFTQMGKGGRDFPGPWGVSKSPNITPAALKGWSDAEVKRAITQGVSRDGHKLKPPMGYGFYARMTDGDLDAVVAWLRTLKPVE